MVSLGLSCGDVREQLSALHDEELPIEERIALAGHLDGCPACAAEVEDLQTIREALRGAAAAIQADWSAELSGLQAALLSRATAERDQSLTSRASRLLDDPQRVWATCGAVVGSTICAILMLGVLVEAANHHPNSLAAILHAMARAAQVRADGPVVLPRANPDAVMPATVMSQREGEDMVSAFAAVVTADGNLADVELLQAEDAAGVAEAQNRRLTSDLLAAAATARFEPARIAGEAVAVNMIWLVAHTTVRGKLVDDKAAMRTARVRRRSQTLFLTSPRKSDPSNAAPV